MSSTELETLRWQFGLTWKLAGVHVPALTDESCMWEPAPGCWNVQRSADGRWRPDWADAEPDPPPSTTIAWLTWHLIWWWSGLLDAVRGAQPAAHHEVDWPGNADAVVRRLEALAAEWSDVLSKLDDGDLEKPLTYPWRESRPLRLALAWANSELMKNVAEIGYVRLLFEASRDRR